VRTRVAASLILIALAIVSILGAFALSLTNAARQFEHALIAQRQSFLVERIARDANADDFAAMRDNLREYRALIISEQRYLPGKQGNSVEAKRADDLTRLADENVDHQRLRAVVRTIADAERAEVADARAGLDSTRWRTMAWGCLLALAAIGATVVGAMQLLCSNRDLAGEVAARTAELRAIDQSRRLFFAKASHELRTPVTAIRAIAEVALADHGDSRSALDDIVSQTDFLGHRIEDMLGLAMAAEGRPVVIPVPCDLAEVLDLALHQAGPFARSMDVAIRADHAGAQGLALIDKRWLTQALLAVIDNGLKFSAPGDDLVLGLTISAGSATITVTDSGPGVVERELPRIFDAYYQADEGRSRGGTGLGLALARWVVEQHHGTIHAENRGGADRPGCRIVMTIPLLEGVA